MHKSFTEDVDNTVLSGNASRLRGFPWKPRPARTEGTPAEEVGTSGDDEQHMSDKDAEFWTGLYAVAVETPCPACRDKVRDLLGKYCIERRSIRLMAVAARMAGPVQERLDYGAGPGVMV